MSYDRLKVAKPMKQLLRAVELYTRHIAKENRGQWRDARMVLFGCFGNLIRAAEVWDSIEKDNYLRVFLDNFAVFRGMMQIFMNTKVISIKKASEIGSYTADIRQQVTGWRKEIVRDSVPLRPNGESNI